jgi:hypothetical protein
MKTEVLKYGHLNKNKLSSLSVSINVRRGGGILLVLTPPVQEVTSRHFQEKCLTS